MIEYHVKELCSLVFPFEYIHTVYIRLKGNTFTFYPYRRDGYDCAIVYVDAYCPDSFLLRIDGTDIWYGDFDVEQERLVKEIDGILYRGERDKPTDWIKLDVENEDTKKDLINIINSVINLNKETEM